MGAIPGLIVVLNKINEELRWLRVTLHPAGLAGLQRNLALVDKPFCQRPGEFFLWFKRKILVVRVRLTGGKHVSRVVEIIIPLSGKQRRIAVLITRMQENDVAAVFRGQVNMTVRDRLTDLLCNFWRICVFELSLIWSMASKRRPSRRYSVSQ